MIYLVPGTGTADLLNHEKAYLPITGALVYVPGYIHPPEAKDLKASTGFLALRKERIQWVVGGKPAEPRTSPSLLERRRLAFLFGTTSWRASFWCPRVCGFPITSPRPSPSRPFGRPSSTPFPRIGPSWS